DPMADEHAHEGGDQEREADFREEGRVGPAPARLDHGWPTSGARSIAEGIPRPDLRRGHGAAETDPWASLPAAGWPDIPGVPPWGPSMAIPVPIATPTTMATSARNPIIIRPGPVRPPPSAAVRG